MFDSIIRLSLKNRVFVLAFAMLIMAYGALILQKLPVDVLPDLNKPTVNILTEAPGMAPEEVEVMVSRPLEIAVNGTAGVSRIYSTSTTGLSVVRIEFDWNTDLKDARLLVNERLPLAQQYLPDHIKPVISPTSSIMGEIQMIGITSRSGNTSPAELRTFADWTVRQRLLSIPGVSQIVVIGGDELQAQVLVNAEKLRRKQISILDMKDRLSRINEATGGGFIDANDREWLIRNFGRILNHEEIAKTVIGLHFGEPVAIKDVAKVDFAAAPKRGEAAVNGQRGVILMVQKQPSAGTLALTDRVDNALEVLKNNAPEDIQIHGALFKQSEFINNAIHNVTEALRDGSIMVTLVLILFLLNYKTTLITLTAIPLSIAVTAIVFYIFGIGVNTMTLGGLAIAIGELVDDAIVDVENVHRRLRENRLKPEKNRFDVRQVVFKASKEIRSSIVFATVIVVLVFIPLFALPGFEGRLFVPIGIAYVTSLIASLFVALTVTPVLCSYLLKNNPGSHDRESALVRFLKAWDARILERTLNHPYRIMLVSCLLFSITASLVPTLGRDFLPAFNEGSAMLEVQSRSGISLDASDRLASEIERSILEIPEVVSIGRRTGRAEEDDHAAGVNRSELEIALQESERTRTEIFNDIRARANALTPNDAFSSVSQPISHRLDHIQSGVKSQVAIKVFGPDLRVLRQEAANIRKVIEGVEGVVDLRVGGQVLFPQYKIYAMRPYLQKYGILPGDLMKTLEAMLQGVPVTRLLERERYLDVYLRLDEESRGQIETIRTLPIHVTPTGDVVPLEKVTDIFPTSGPNRIVKEDLQRRVVVSFNTTGRDLNSVVNDVKERLNNMKKIRDGYYYVFDGQYESQRRAMRMVAILGFISLLGIFFVLYAQFQSAPIAFQIMANIPLALVGSVIAIFLSGGTLSVASMIAFITLCGIAARNGIMMVSHYVYLMREEEMSFGKEMIIRGSTERLIPVLMTAFTAILALSPLLLAADQPGKEILHPVAVVIVGGLLSSTLLDIFLTPALFYRFGRKSAERLLKSSNQDW